MSTEEKMDYIKRRRLCFNCIEEKFLKEKVSQEGDLGACFYCDKSATCFSLGKLSQLVQTAFEQHYHRTPPGPSGYELAMEKEWEQAGEPVVDAIRNTAKIPYDAALDIQVMLEEQCFDYEAAKIGEELEFSTESFYEKSEPDDKRWQKEWNNFEHLLKTETRFFSQSASQLLTSVFAGIDTMTTRNGKSLIVDAGPGTNYSTIYRARTFQSDDMLKGALAQPHKHLASPPSTVATAGRMNAHGISVFYGADDPMVALAEVRPPINSKVAIARFEIIRPLKLLDLTALSDVATNSDSIFNPSYKDHLEHTMFLRRLSDLITRPVMPDHEPFDYLATQAVTDFLSAEYSPSLDGIIFPSVQAANGVNIVLFHKAARVETIERPMGMNVMVSLVHEDEEGCRPEYNVFEEVMSKEKENIEPVPREWNPDQRLSTLRIAQGSIYVHIVDSIEFHTRDLKVSTVRYYDVPKSLF